MRKANLRSLPGGGLWERFKSFLRKRRNSQQAIPRAAVADLLAINDLIGNWDHWQARRTQVQSLRKREDIEILPLFLRPMWCIEPEGGYQELQAGLSSLFGIEELFHGLTSLKEDPKG